MDSKRDANVTIDGASVTPYGEPPHQARENDLWVPAAVKLSDDGGCLLYRDREGARNPRRVRPGKRTLAGFLGLVEAEEAGRAVLSFAQRWGVLNLCERHELPCEHDRASLRLDFIEEGHEEPVRCDPRYADGSSTQVVELECATRAEALGWKLPEFPGRRGPDRWWKLEPVARWLDYSRQFGEVLALAMELRVSPPPYRLASGGDADSEWTRAALDRSPYVKAEKLLGRTQQWQDLGHVRDVLQWTQGGLVRVRAGGGLFGALVIELLDAIEGGAKDMFRCPHCREVEERKGRYRVCCDKPGCKQAEATKRQKASRERRRNRERVGEG